VVPTPTHGRPGSAHPRRPAFFYFLRPILFASLAGAWEAFEVPVNPTGVPFLNFVPFVLLLAWGAWPAVEWVPLMGAVEDYAGWVVHQAVRGTLSLAPNFWWCPEVVPLTWEVYAALGLASVGLAAARLRRTKFKASRSLPGLDAG
jgi:hypothetical protein